MDISYISFPGEEGGLAIYRVEVDEPLRICNLLGTIKISSLGSMVIIEPQKDFELITTSTEQDPILFEAIDAYLTGNTSEELIRIIHLYLKAAELTLPAICIFTDFPMASN